MAEHEDIFGRIDAAVLMAAQMDANDEAPASMGWDKPAHASGVYLALMHTYPAIRTQFLGSGFMMLKTDTKEELVRDSIRRLVRKGFLIGYDILVPVSKLTKSGARDLVTMSARRYRPLSILEVLAQLSS